jgi:hypothetical protein
MGFLMVVKNYDEMLRVQNMNFGNIEVSDIGTVIRHYGENEFASPFRSTVPMLAYWQGLEGRLQDFLGCLGLVGNAADLSATFEAKVKPPQGRGKASCTDLLLSGNGQRIAIEAKYTEPIYETVANWLTAGSNIDNRRDVLSGWLALINAACGTQLTIDAVQGVVYQLLHRTASACAVPGAKPVVVYQVFTTDKHEEYTASLNELRRLIPNSAIEFFLYELDFIPNAELQELMVRWQAGEREGLAAPVIALLETGNAGQFGKVRLTQI